jgi:hypothetical protein
MQHKWKNVLTAFDVMKAAKVKPNTFTMNLIIGTLAGAGQVRKWRAREAGGRHGAGRK